MTKIKLLDCTLRDGGYINDWEFGNGNIVNIFERLVSAGIDIIEVGFLDAGREFDGNRTIMPGTEAVNKIFGSLDKGNSLVVGMIDFGTCGIENLLPCEQCFLDGIRIIFKKEVMFEAIAFCKEVKQLGYKVFAQAVSITSYDDRELEQLAELVNDLEPYAFSLVDTYGLLHKSSLMHYFIFADRHLKNSIGIGYHAHNNFQLAYANCIELMENPPAKRTLILDGSLHGMGKSAGNAPMELLATYMNEQLHTKYQNSQLLEAIDVTILDIYRKIPWGYSFKFFVAASHDCHPNYVTYLMDKKKLSINSIHEILNSVDNKRKLLYEKEYIEELYLTYQKRACVDISCKKRLKEKWKGQDILLLAPGKHVIEEKDKVEKYININHPIIIAVNFLPEIYKVDYLFISNAKRYVQMSSQISRRDQAISLIATSNVTKTKGCFDYILQYSKMLDEEALIVDNPMVMLIKLLNECGAGSIACAGFDGYTKARKPNYINPNMEYSISSELAWNINQDVAESIGRIENGIPIRFITKTQYTLK